MALSLIPEEDLRAAAQKAVEESGAKEDLPILAEEDALVRQLLQWFKQKFFKWVRPCVCGPCLKLHCGTVHQNPEP
jgi:hypothetical protein